MRPNCIVFAVLALSPVCLVAAEKKEVPFRVADFNLGESQTISLPGRPAVVVRLVSMKEVRDPIRDAVRGATLGLDIDGKPATLIAGPYRLPTPFADIQIDCTVTKGMNSNGTPEFWGLDKDARLRFWPTGSPRITPGTFQYPLRQRWFASHTQMMNEPTFADGGELPNARKIYYHSGLDIGGSEGQVEVVAAADGIVVSVGKEVLPAHRTGTPIAPRYDVVYLLDDRGWYYRYSHLKEIDAALVPGRMVTMGQRVGVLGKEGGSGGWSHLHFEIKSRQPSGKWGTQDGYAFLWDAYLAEHRPNILAVARPHHLVRPGDAVELDGSRSRSFSWDGTAPRTVTYRWTFADGSTADSAQATRSYDSPGVYSEVLKVTDSAGNVDYDFCIVQVLDPAQPNSVPPTIHPAYAPTFGIKPGDPVTFKVRTFRTTDGSEVWDFGDGTPRVTVQSDGNVKQLAPDGYAVTTHTYAKPGVFVARVSRTNRHGQTATGHVKVVVEAPK